MNTYIYGLIDPRTGEVKYVGNTVNPDKRYKQHLRELRGHLHRLSKWGCVIEDWAIHPKLSWMAALFSEAGVYPTLTILEEVPEKKGRVHEKQWIDKFLSEGGDLVNVEFVTRGGISGRRSKKHSATVLNVGSRSATVGGSGSHKRRGEPKLHDQVADKQGVGETGIVRSTQAAATPTIKQLAFPKLLTIPDVAKIFRVSQVLVRRMLLRGDLNGYRVGREWRVTEQELTRFMNEGPARK